MIAHLPGRAYRVDLTSSTSQQLQAHHTLDMPQGSAGHAGAHGTTGFGGGGATAFPAQESGKDLHGEHLSDFDKV